MPNLAFVVLCILVIALAVVYMGNAWGVLIGVWICAIAYLIVHFTE